MIIVNPSLPYASSSAAFTAARATFSKGTGAFSTSAPPHARKIARVGSMTSDKGSVTPPPILRVPLTAAGLSMNARRPLLSLANSSRANAST